MNDMVLKAFIPLIRKTFIRCGVVVAGLAAVIFGIIAFHGELAWAVMQIADFMTGPVFELFLKCFNAIGNLHIAVHAIVFMAYAWISCVWWKLKSVAGIKLFAAKLKVWMVSLGFVNAITLLAAITNQPQGIALYLLPLFGIVFMKLCLVDIMPAVNTKYECRDV